MKKITIVRHAKSSWKYNVGDLNRSLKKRGITDVLAISNEFKTKYLEPDFVFVSPAKRAQETCNIFLKNIDFSSEKVQTSDEIYDFGGEKLVNFVKSIDDKYNNVMIFGHNYALTNFINLYGSQYLDNLPTSGLAILEFEIDLWKDLKLGKTKVLIIPKDLR